MRQSHRRKGAKLVSAGFHKGWQTGYQLGQSYGHHIGRCDAVMQSTAPSLSLPKRQIRLMFVISGQGDPYATIEHGLLESLGTLVTELLVISPFEDVTAAVIAAKPDLLIVFNGLNYVPPEMIQQIRKQGIRTAVWFTDDPYYTDHSAAIALNYEIVFTQERSCVDFYREQGCSEVFYAPLAAAPNIYRPQRTGSQFHTDICFLGSGYRNRISLFDAIAPTLGAHHTFIAGRWWERLEHHPALESCFHGDAAWLTSEETVSYYAGAKIVINCHRAFDDDEINANSLRIPAFSPNPRTFEIAATATLQLVDARDELAAFYNPGEEIETYSSPEELSHKIEYYLSHESHRRRIALNGLVRTLREHTYTARLQRMLLMVFGP